jgi:hypothetical protein
MRSRSWADALIEIATVAASIDRRPNEEARTVYKAFTLGGQFTGKRDMFFYAHVTFFYFTCPASAGFFLQAYRKRGIRPSLLGAST